MIYGGLFDVDKCEYRIKELDSELLKPDFWSDKRKAEGIIAELNNLKKILESVSNIKNKISDNLSLAYELKSNQDADLISILENDIEPINKVVDELEIEILLNKPYDNLDAILEIHSGAGGTEACDWANMLYRMYERWAVSHGYKIEVLDTQFGDEAGVKSITLLINGLHAYGYLKCEKGVHRLVRISPFDAGARRHTSFASVDVIPKFEKNDIDIEVLDSDIRVDVYRSSGCGGQGVNTTDSAVRITHLKTGIVVTCQNERSQIQNKERAMEVLKNKLYQLEIEKRNQEMQELKGKVMDINFGSQIRSYVMHPYSLVKDHRTNIETSNVGKVLDGDIDLFIHGFLKGSV